MIFIEGSFNMAKSSFEKGFIMNATFIRYIRKVREGGEESSVPMPNLTENAVTESLSENNSESILETLDEPRRKVYKKK